MQGILAPAARLFTQAFLLIAEPRVLRLLQFGVYICMTIAGGWLIANPPVSFQSVIGAGLVALFGGFLGLGGLLGAIAVLPGVWWLERAGIIALITGLLIYVTIVVALGSSVTGIVVCIAFALQFTIRWTEIRRYDLAPKR